MKKLFFGTFLMGVVLLAGILFWRANFSQKEKIVHFDDGKTFKVNEQTAKTILKVYSALNEDNKKKLAEMAQMNKENFVKVFNFAQQELLKQDRKWQPQIQRKY